MANGKQHSIKITSIQCHGTSEAGSLNDEVFVIYQADAGLPIRYPAVGYQSMNTSSSSNAVQTWDIDLVLDFDNEVLVTLWDDDPGLERTSDFLINCDYDSPNPPSSYNMKNHNGANYTLYAEAVSE